MGSVRIIQQMIKCLSLSVCLGIFLWCFTAEAQTDRDFLVEAGHHQPDYARGVDSFRAGDYYRAADYFRRVVQSDQANTNAHYYLGLTFDRLGLTSEALSEYELVIRQGREAKMVRYAHERFNALASVSSGAQNTAQPEMAGMQSVAYQSVVPLVARPVMPPSHAPVKVFLKNTQNALMVDAVLSHEGQKSGGAFILDTGATYTSISQQMAQQLGLDLSDCEKVLITTANGRIEVPKIVIQSLEVNGIRAHNVEVTVIPVRAGASFSGLLGLSFMRQFVVTIDPQAGHLIFQKSPLF